MGSRWHGQVVLAAGGHLYRGRIGAARTHSHHAVQLLVAYDGAFVLRGADGVDHAMRAAVIPANTPHTITEGVPDGLLALMDPDSTRGRRLDPDAVPTGSAALWRRDEAAPAADAPLDDAVEAAIRRITGAETAPPRRRHPAVAEAVRLVAARLPERIRLAEVARSVHISGDRLAHLFRDELGLPFRPYVRWARLERAVALLSAGESLTHAAHAAGFTDSAHLNKTFHLMFGLGPSEILRGVRIGQQVRTSRRA